MQSKTPSTNAKTTKQDAAKMSAHKQPSALLVSSLALNGIFIALLIAFSVLTHVRTLWFAGKAFSIFQNTCPTQVATRVETKTSGDISTSTYYVNSQALQSGCATALLGSAQLDNYRAYPDKAKIDADAFRKLTPEHILNVTVVKSSESGTQLAPLQIKQ